MTTVEQDIVRLYSEGYYIWEIADKCGVSEYYVVCVLGKN